MSDVPWVYCVKCRTMLFGEHASNYRTCPICRAEFSLYGFPTQEKMRESVRHYESLLNEGQHATFHGTMGVTHLRPG
jgi:hypothetical protein